MIRVIRCSTGIYSKTYSDIADADRWQAAQLVKQVFMGVDENGNRIMRPFIESPVITDEPDPVEIANAAHDALLDAITDPEVKAYLAAYPRG